MARLLVCGMTVADFVFGVPAMPQRAEKYVAHSAEMIIGGGAANAAIAIARQKGSASLVARIGDDWMGKAISQILEDEQVDCSLLQIGKSATTSFSSVLVDAAGERQIVNFRGAGLAQQPDWLSNHQPPGSVQVNGHFDGVLTDTRWTEGAVALLQMARRAGVPGVVDGEAPIPDQILECASHVAFSRQGLTAYTGIEQAEKSLQAASTRLDAWVCVTDGNNGVLHVQDGQIEHTPTHPIEVRDTLAAGDVWHGVFALGLCEGQSEKSAIEYANAAATLKCASLGGGLAAPNREQTLQFMQQQF